MTLNKMGVSDVTGVELADLGFIVHLREALFPLRYVEEMERTVRRGEFIPPLA